MITDKISRLLLAPPASGRIALLYVILLVAIPTGIRYLLEPIIHGWLPFFSYIPFVIVAGALLNWKHAALVALASWIIANLLFMAPMNELGFGPVHAIGFIVFSTSAAMIIGLVEAVRTIVENSLRPTRPDGFSAPVVFSLEGGQAWASWYGSHSWVRLGPEDEVAEMMEDFLSQRELGKRLERNAAARPRPSKP